MSLHHALGLTGRPRGINDKGKLVAGGQVGRDISGRRILISMIECRTEPVTTTGAIKLKHCRHVAVSGNLDPQCFS